MIIMTIVFEATSRTAYFYDLIKLKIKIYNYLFHPNKKESWVFLNAQGILTLWQHKDLKLLFCVLSFFVCREHICNMNHKNNGHIQNKDK